MKNKYLTNFLFQLFLGMIGVLIIFVFRLNIIGKIYTIFSSIYLLSFFSFIVPQNNDKADENYFFSNIGNKTILWLIIFIPVLYFLFPLVNIYYGLIVLILLIYSILGISS